MPKKTEEVVNDPLQRFRSIFTEVEAPKGGLPSLPTKISDIPNDMLGDITMRYASWREFTEDRHLEACAVYAQVKSKYDFICDKEALMCHAETVTEKKMIAKTSKAVMDISNELLEAETFKNLLAGKLESFNNVLSTLSRELTRRGVSGGY